MREAMQLLMDHVPCTPSWSVQKLFGVGGGASSTRMTSRGSTSAHLAHHKVSPTCPTQTVYRKGTEHHSTAHRTEAQGMALRMVQDRRAEGPEMRKEWAPAHHKAKYKKKAPKRYFTIGFCHSRHSSAMLERFLRNSFVVLQRGLCRPHGQDENRGEERC